MKRLWRWSLRLAVTALLLGLAAVPAVYVGLPVLARQERARHRVEKAIAKSLGTPVRIDQMAWSWKQGLVLTGLSGGGPGTSFDIDVVSLKPDVSRLLKGKVRARVVLESPTIVVRDIGTYAPQFNFPRLCRKGLKLQGVDLSNGTYVWESAAYGETVRVENIRLRGSGLLGKRQVSLDIAEFHGRLNGKPVQGMGALSANREGISGSLDARDVSPEDRQRLQRAMQAANIAVKVPSPISEPF